MEKISRASNPEKGLEASRFHPSHLVVMEKGCLKASPKKPEDAGIRATWFCLISAHATYAANPGRRCPFKQVLHVRHNNKTSCKDNNWRTRFLPGWQVWTLKQAWKSDLFGLSRAICRRKVGWPWPRECGHFPGLERKCAFKNTLGVEKHVGRADLSLGKC